MKHIITILTLVLVITLAGCGGTPASVPDTSVPAQESGPVELVQEPEAVTEEPEPEPAEFLLSNLQVEIGKTGVAGSLIAEVGVQNVGGLKGTYELTSKVDEETRDILEVELNPGEKKTIDLIKTATRIGMLRLSYERGETGIERVHIVSVGDLSKTITFPEREPEIVVEEPETKTDREDMIEIFKANALADWGDDYEMVKYVVDRQTEAYDWVVEQTEYPEIMERAKSEWQNDYEMIKYAYENQVETYVWIMRQTAYPDILARAKDRWYPDYEMVKYEYENQVEAYEWIMRQTAYPDIMEEAKRKWGGDYEMVKYEYENQVKAYEASQ